MNGMKKNFAGGRICKSWNHNLASLVREIPKFEIVVLIPLQSLIGQLILPYKASGGARQENLENR